MAALENDRPPLACVHAVGVLKNITHHIIARVVFIATCRPHPSPSRPDVSPLGLHGFHLYPSLSLHPPLANVAAEKWEMIARLLDSRALFKIHERFYCSPLPPISPQKRHIERERERECVAHISKRSALDKSRETGMERERERCAATPRNILIVEFSVRVAYPLEPRFVPCQPRISWLLITLTTNFLIPLRARLAASFRRFQHFLSLSTLFLSIFISFFFLYI